MNTALVPVGPERLEQSISPAERRGNADFIAHLIGTALGAPQTRARRRAGLDQALAAYRVLRQWPSETGRTLARSL